MIVLVGRLSVAIQQFVIGFDDPSASHVSPLLGNTDDDKAMLTPMPPLPRRTHTLVLQGGQLVLQPPLDRSRVTWCCALRDWIAIVTAQRALRRGSYDAQLRSDSASGHVGGGGEFGDASASLKRLLHQLPAGTVWPAHECIDRLLREARGRLAAHWKQHEALWQFDLVAETEALGDQLESWQRRLASLRQGSAALLEPGVAAGIGARWECGPLTLEAQQLQASMVHKYEILISDLLDAFGTLLSRRLKSLLQSTREARLTLEKTSAAVALGGGGGGGVGGTNAGVLTSLVDFISSLRCGGPSPPPSSHCVFATQS